MAEWKAANDAALGKWNAKSIYPLCDATVPKGAVCGILARTYSDPGFQKTFADQRCVDPPADASADFCSDLLISDFVAALNKRYGLRPQDVCPGNDCGSFVKVELVMLKAFDEKIGEQEQAELGRITAKYRAMSDAVMARFKSQSDQIESDTTQHHDHPQRRRAALAAVGAGLQAYGSALQNSAPPPQQPLPTVQAVPKCSNDFECDYGNACVKDSGAFQGVCAKVTNAYGIPTYQAPRSDSIGPGTGDCSFDTDCGPGWRCQKTSGGLLRQLHEVASRHWPMWLTAPDPKP